MTRPRVAVVPTGGTIDSVGRDRLDIAWYVDNATRLDDAVLLARVPEIADVADVELVPFRKVSSTAITDRDWLDLAALVEDLAGRVDGVVVTHGTNTLEETAYFLHLALRCEVPVVLVGAMRPPSALSSDGDLNLLNAVAVAAAPESAGRGVLVVLNDTVFSARDVTKAATYRVNAFVARDTGPLGYADADGRVVFEHRPERPHTSATEFDLRGVEALPRVDVIVSHVGADGVLVQAAVAAGARGVVCAASGAGRLGPTEEAVLAAAREEGVAVCVASRVGAGRVVRGAGATANGFVAAGNLVPWKARVLLALGLTATADPGELQRMFDTY